MQYFGNEDVHHILTANLYVKDFKIEKLHEEDLRDAIEAQLI